MAEKFQDGVTILRIVNTKSAFDGHYGRLLKVRKDGDPEGPLEVKFGAECRYLFGAYFKEENTCRFHESEVEVVPDFPIEIKVTQLFGGMAHSIVRLADGFDPNAPCMHEDCERSRTKRGLTNVWGVVHEFDACDEHYIAYHGKNVDEFPYRRDPAPSANGNTLAARFIEDMGP